MFAGKGLSARIQQQKRDLTKDEKEQLINYVKDKVREDKSEESVSYKLSIAVNQYISKNHPANIDEIRELEKEVWSHLYSLGPLEQYLEKSRKGITDIKVIGLNIYYKDNGIRKKDPKGFINHEHLNRIIDRMMSQAQAGISTMKPSRNIELYDGSRAIVIIPPEVEEPIISIRRYTLQEAKLDDIELKGLSNELKERIKDWVKRRKNFCFIGETGAGKTTTINAIANEIQSSHSIAVLEDTREIWLPNHEMAMYMQTREKTESAEAIDWLDIITDCLRLDPDRIIVTEIRTGAAAYAYCQAVNSGHSGSLTTAHANSAYDGLLKLDKLIKQETNLEMIDIKEMVARSMDIVGFIKVDTDDDGNILSRSLAELVEVIGVAGGDYALKYYLGQPEKLGEILIKNNKLLPKQLLRSLKLQEVIKAKLGDILVENRYVTEGDIDEAICEQREIDNIH